VSSEVRKRIASRRVTNQSRVVPSDPNLVKNPNESDYPLLSLADCGVGQWYRSCDQVTGEVAFVVQLTSSSDRPITHFPS
jgi:hypothetical protein